MTVNSGTVLLGKTSSGSVHALGYDSTINGGTLQLTGTGGDQILGGRILTLTSGTFDLNGNSEDIGGLAGSAGAISNTASLATLSLTVPTGSNMVAGASLNNALNLVKGGLGKQTLTGADLRTSGTNAINQGILQIGNGGGSGSLVGVTTINANGTLAFNLSGPNTFSGSLTGAGSVAQNGPGTLTLSVADTHTGNTLVNTGTLAVPTGASSIAGSNITVATGATLDLSAASGSFALGLNQVLNGAGLVRGNFIIGSLATLGGQLGVQGNVFAGDGAIISPGGTFSAGTLAVSNNLTLSTCTLAFELANVTTPGGGTNDLLVVGGTLDLSAGPTLQISALSGTLAAGTYTIATYGTLVGSPSAVVIQGSSRFTFALSASAGKLLLTVGGNPGSLVWRGNGTSNPWNVQITADWINHGTNDFFNPGDVVLFDDSGSNNVPVAIASSVVPGTVTVSAAKDYLFGGLGSIDGLSGLTKSGAGTLTLTNNHGFQGNVNLNGGTVSVPAVALNGTASPLGGGSTLAFNGGALRYTGPAVGAAGFNRQLTLGAGGGTIDQSSSSGIFLSITNLISGSGSLTKTGTNQLIIGDVQGGVPVTGNNTYDGITYVANGQLQMRHPYALGSTVGKTVVTSPGNVAAGGTWSGTVFENFDLSGDGGGNGALQVNDGNNVTFAGNITLVTNASLGGASPMTVLSGIAGPGQLSKGGVNTVTLLSSANTYGGGTVVNSGTLQLGTNGTSGWLAPQPGSLPLTNNGTLTFNRADTNTFADAITGTGGLAQNGSGVTILSGANSFTGAIHVNNGSLRAANSSALGGPTAVVYPAASPSTAALELAGGITVSNAMTFIARADSATSLRSFSGTNDYAGVITVTSGGTGYGIEAAAGSGLLVSGLITNPLTGSFGGSRPLILNGDGFGDVTGTIDKGTANFYIVKAGNGTWRLSGYMNYSDAIYVNAGTLILDNELNNSNLFITGGTLLANTNLTINNNITSSGNFVVNGNLYSPANVFINSGGTLGGTGTVYGAVTVLPGGTLAPGDSIGTLTIAANLTIGGDLSIEVNKALSPALSNDFVTVYGFPQNTNNGTVHVVNLGPALAVGDTFQLFNQPVYNGDQLTISAPGVTWTNNLAVDGTISVLAAAPPVNPNPTNLTYSVSGSALTLAWPADHTGWRLLVQTNHLSAGVSTDPADWDTVPNSTDVNQVIITLDPAKKTEFYRLVYP